MPQPPTHPHANAHPLLTPAMRGLLERMARAGHPPLHSLPAPAARDAYERGAGVLDLAPHPLQRVQTLQLPCRDGATISARLYTPAPDTAHHESGGGRHETPPPWPVLVYFHGGGFTVGSLSTHDALCRQLAHLTPCAVVSVGYRLAPEHKFPTAVHDAWDSTAWLRQHAGALQLDAQRMAVGGDSAGGTLAAVTAIHERDGGRALALQLLLYPGTASHAHTESHRRFGRGLLLESAHLDYFFGHYLRHAADRRDWRFAPLDGLDDNGQLRELEGVAPAWMGLAGCDPLVDEGLLYADRLRMARVPVDLEIYRGVVHGFVQFGRAIKEARSAHADAARALRTAFSLSA